MDTNRFFGCLLGTAVGDALGLPAEGLTPARRARLFGELTGYRLVFGRGLVSDDTEHAILTAQALIASGGAPDRFGRELAARLRLWFLALPPGAGLATVRACLRLCLGFSAERSGVASAGNGPAMRAAVIGAFCADDSSDARLRVLIRIASRITHTDPRAEAGALRIALRAAGHPCDFLEPSAPGPVSGFIVATVAAVDEACQAHPDDFSAAVLGVIARGGDTDTTAALVGGVLGARLGSAAIPAAWRTGLAEPLWTPARLERLAQQLAAVAETRDPQRPVTVPWLLCLVRNLVVLGIVLCHGFRRLLPPY